MARRTWSANPEEVRIHPWSPSGPELNASQERHYPRISNLFPIKQTKLTPPSRYLRVRQALDHQCIHQENSCGCFDESITRESQLEFERDGLRISLTAAETQNGMAHPQGVPCHGQCLISNGASICRKGSSACPILHQSIADSRIPQVY